MTEPAPRPPEHREAPRERARPPDVRYGSATDALTPISVAERSLAAGHRQWLALGLAVAAALLADQLTKRLVVNRLELGEQLGSIGPLSIHHVQNSGIAFGLFSESTSVVIVLTAIAVSWMLVFFARSGSRHPILPVALGFVLGGSLANLLDRVRLGYVVDFIELHLGSYQWPTFNVADAAICVGAGLLALDIILEGRQEGRMKAVTSDK